MVPRTRRTEAGASAAIARLNRDVLLDNKGRGCTDRSVRMHARHHRHTITRLSDLPSRFATIRELREREEFLFCFVLFFLFYSGSSH